MGLKKSDSPHDRGTFPCNYKNKVDIIKGISTLFFYINPKTPDII